MSFSSDVKVEISKLNNRKQKEAIKAELIGYLFTNNISISGQKIRFSTENEYNINRFSKLLNDLKIDYKIEISGNVFIISFKKPQLPEEFIVEEGKLILKDINIIEEAKQNEVVAKAIVRGAFLGSGSLTDPNKNYHLEIILSKIDYVGYIQEILEGYEILGKVLKRKNASSFYMKDGEDISRFLAFVGASSSMIRFEEIRVLRDMRNNVNRIVNCETANLNKTVNTGVRQIEDIKLIRKKKKFDDLPENLKEIAILREQNPDMSLVDLGKNLEEPIGKSGVNHRFQKIKEIAEELRR